MTGNSQTLVTNTHVQPTCISYLFVVTHVLQLTSISAYPAPGICVGARNMKMNLESIHPRLEGGGNGVLRGLWGDRMKNMTGAPGGSI